MATTPTKPTIEVDAQLADPRLPSWPMERSGAAAVHDTFYPASPDRRHHDADDRRTRPLGADALQALLAFSALHQQVRKRRALAFRHKGFDTVPQAVEFEEKEQFVLDEVLQLVAERAIAITGADGLGIALAENNEIVLRASAGVMKPDVGARIQRDSAFSGACFRTAQIIRCDDTEMDERVNLSACRRLGARSMVAVPLCGRRRVIGLLEAFSGEPFGFNDSDVTSLELLAELILGALKPEDEDRFAEAAQVAEAELVAAALPSQASSPAEIPSEKVAAAAESVAQPGAASRAAPATIEPEIVAIKKSLPASEPSKDKNKDDKDNDQADIAETAAVTEASVTETVAEPVAEHHPGIVLVLVLIVLSVMVAGGIWWKLKTAQLSQVLIQPEQKMSMRPGAIPKQPSDVSGSSSVVAPSIPVPDGQENSSVNSGTMSNLDGQAEPSSGNLTPQEPAKPTRIAGIRHWSAADSSTVVLDLEDQVQYEAHRLSNPDRIYFDLHDTSLAPDLEGKTIEIGDRLLARVRVAHPATGMTRVVLETRGNSTYSVSLEPNPYRLVVQVRKVGADGKSQLNLFPGTGGERDKLAIVVPPPTREDLQIRTRVAKLRIVVDAGHGGWDLGTVGRRGLLEKDLVLEIAQRLGKLLESRLGAEVILTRNDDNYIPLDERAEMANHSQADLFVSVHANYSDLPSARGVETYYTNSFSAPNAKDLETRPGAAGNKNPMTAALSPADLHDRIEQSRRLAASVQRSLYGTLSADNPGLRDRGVKEASYVVLTETAMPGILAEVSFVSSPTDEQKLRSDGYREQIAEALYRGIARYAASSKGVKVASAAK
jgi:N-acetylmuramoyl-L-alanine amidase/putative methionine-R-sulfoxide reductase with GAF domain